MKWNGWPTSKRISGRNGLEYAVLRQIEEDILLNLKCFNHVIATGGSAVYSHSAMKYLKSQGVIVFLDVDLPTLKSRIHNFETRGLAKHPDQTFADLFEERGNLYKNYADITIDCGNLKGEFRLQVHHVMLGGRLHVVSGSRGTFLVYD